MNTHDIDIELPPLPQGEYRLSPDSRAPTLYDEEAMEAYARAAIEADRKRRGDPVAWLVRDDMLGTWLFRWDEPEPGMWKYVKPLYAVPQPAETVKALVDSQEPLGKEFQRVLDDNRWDLYMKGGEPVKGQTGKTVLQSNQSLNEPVKVPSKLSNAEILSLAYDVGAMPEQATDATLVRFARALLTRYGNNAGAAHE